DDLIGHLKALEAKYPALDRISVSLSVGVPESEALEQLERFAKEVMPAFTGAKAQAVAAEESAHPTPAARRSKNTNVILRSAPKARVSKDGSRPRVCFHPSRRPCFARPPQDDGFVCGTICKVTPVYARPRSAAGAPGAVVPRRARRRGRRA